MIWNIFWAALILSIAIDLEIGTIFHRLEHPAFHFGRSFLQAVVTGLIMLALWLATKDLKH